MIEEQKSLGSNIGMINVDAKELSIEWLIAYSLLQAVNLGTQDLERFALAVDNIESLAMDEIERDSEKIHVCETCQEKYKSDYAKLLERKDKQLDDLYGTQADKAARRMREYYTFKFRILIKILKRKIPLDVTGII